MELYLGGADRDQLDPILDACVADLQRAARRGRPGRLQGQGQGLRPHLRLPRLDPALHQRRLGEALDLPELPDPEAAGAEGGGPLEGHPRSHRHGQLPRREAGGDARSSCRTQDAEIEPVPTSGGGAQARAGAGPALATSSRPSTTSSATSPGPTRTGSTSSSPRTSRPRSPPTRPTRTP